MASAPLHRRYAAMAGRKALGLQPFLPGDLMKLALAALALPAGWELLGVARKIDNERMFW